jgi:hypothetical protein
VSTCCPLFLRGSLYAGPALRADGSGISEGCSFTANNPFGFPTSSPLGNVSSFNFEPQTTRLNTKDYTGIGEDCSSEIVENVNVSFTLLCMDGENFNRAFNTKSITRAGVGYLLEQISGCGVYIGKDFLVPVTNGPIDLSKSFVLQAYNQVTQGITTLVEGVDYERSTIGVIALKPIQLTGQQVLRASYNSQTTIQSDSTESASCPVSIWYDGKMRASDSCSKELAVTAYFPRVKLDMSDSFELLQKDGSFEKTMTGRLMFAKVQGKRIRYRIWPKVKL